MLHGRLSFARYVANACRPPIGQYASGSGTELPGMMPVRNRTKAASTPHWRRYLGQFLIIEDFLAILFFHYDVAMVSGNGFFPFVCVTRLLDAVRYAVGVLVGDK